MSPLATSLTMGDDKTVPERLAIIETRVDQLVREIDRIGKTLWWIMATLIGAILVAFGNFIVGGGLSPPP